jgi:hypothetical protein
MRDTIKLKLVKDYQDEIADGTDSQNDAKPMSEGAGEHRGRAAPRSRGNRAFMA